MRTVGNMNVWFPDRNYGFVHEEKGGAIIKHFLHGTNIKCGTPKTGSTVRFKSVVCSKGFIAVDAEILDGGQS